MPIQRYPYLSAGERRRYARILALPDAHIARRALIAFYECRVKRVGFEIRALLAGAQHWDYDQEWRSSAEGGTWKLSGLLYAFVSVDDILDGWNTEPLPTAWTAWEVGVFKMMPLLECLLAECADACRANDNAIALNVVQEVSDVFRLICESLKLRGELCGLSCLASPIANSNATRP